MGTWTLEAWTFWPLWEVGKSGYKGVLEAWGLIASLAKWGDMQPCEAQRLWCVVHCPVQSMSHSTMQSMCWELAHPLTEEDESLPKWSKRRVPCPHQPKSIRHHVSFYQWVPTYFQSHTLWFNRIDGRGDVVRLNGQWGEAAGLLP